MVTLLLGHIGMKLWSLIPNIFSSSKFKINPIGCFLYMKNLSIRWNQIILNKHTGIKPWSPKSFIGQNRVGFSTALFGSLLFPTDAGKNNKIWWHLDDGQYLVNLYWLIISEIDRCKKVCLVCVSFTLQGHRWQSD